MANVFNIYGNEDLKSECSDNFQLSAEYRHRNYDFTVGGFHNIVRNGITTVWSDALDGMQYMNIERYNTTGVTANAVAQWSNGLGARVAYTYTHLDNKQHEAQYFPTRPHALTGRVEYGHDWKHYGFNVALSGRFLSSSSTTTLDDSNKPKTTHYPSYSIYKLTLIQHVLKGIDVTMVVDNLFNYRPKYYYSNSPTTNGATFSAGVSIDIDKFFK
jgi:outer membrane receptor for ferrienterochelin and colicins